jgi:hypothetical protein
MAPRMKDWLEACSATSVAIVSTYAPQVHSRESTQASLCNGVRACVGIIRAVHATADSRMSENGRPFYRSGQRFGRVVEGR